MRGDACRFKCSAHGVKQEERRKLSQFCQPSTCRRACDRLTSFPGTTRCLRRPAIRSQEGPLIWSQRDCSLGTWSSFTTSFFFQVADLHAAKTFYACCRACSHGATGESCTRCSCLSGTSCSDGTPAFPHSDFQTVTWSGHDCIYDQ